ncbi:exodeoxyribonuclease VII large subunit [Endozoicomonas sp. SM1973]|uniref:Exodeoxyribonuclease 7 large subunit n=1 Tax=Spartinivicinus marinus TaxID=2994442 RepID=A0A853HTX8_9GAMM|nr:exodeoxyribonuclease VII large subunit [Spartinivicinus marinus]MCX4025551.1 exodeoxyribonuclease VII large subunit [Spartinivicinus marinus]NYZ65220.1 exodeoxyribonuclease VII large subunit [Spartinivicinus marinus]
MTIPTADPYTSKSTPERQVLSVTKLNQQVRRLLEISLGQIWVEGEISNLAIPSSGHWYFTLKDANAQVRCAMFRNKNQLLGFIPEEGTQVLMRAKVSLYEGRGDYQLIAEYLEESGNGALRRAFEQLKQKLAQQGFFEEAHKRPIPELPKHIGVVTSPTGAAIHDILSVLKRRFPAIPITVFPTAVQGKEAAPQIVAAIRAAERYGQCDVLVVGRGGGSLEDLWPFNEEMVAHAIYNCSIPVVSAVGHEVDFTIADFVADLRAPTPSAAAEMLCSISQQEWLSAISNYQTLLTEKLKSILAFHQHQLTSLQKRLRHPGHRLQELSQRFDDLEIRLKQAMDKKLVIAKNQLQLQHNAIQQQSPAKQLLQYKQFVQLLTNRLYHSTQQALKNNQLKMQHAAKQLQMVSPLATLSRGYSITLTEDKSQAIRSYSEVKPGDQLTTLVADGEISCRVEKTTKRSVLKTK